MTEYASTLPLKICPDYGRIALEDLEGDEDRRQRTASTIRHRLEKAQGRTNIWPAGRELDARALLLARLFGLSKNSTLMALVKDDLNVAMEVVNSVARFRADVMRIEATIGKLDFREHPCSHQKDFAMRITFKGGEVIIPEFPEVQRWMETVREGLELSLIHI